MRASTYVNGAVPRDLWLNMRFFLEPGKMRCFRRELVRSFTNDIVKVGRGGHPCHGGDGSMVI